MITNLLILLFFMLGPLALGATLWALGKPQSRWRVISRFSLLTLMLVMIPLGVVFAFVRPVVAMDEFARNITLVCLSRVAPLLLPAMWLIYYFVEEWWRSRRNQEKPASTPNFEFLEHPGDRPQLIADEEATSEFKKSFGTNARKRFAAILCRFNAYFFIQK